jgi:microcystin degradation protein MlrC
MSRGTQRRPRVAVGGIYCECTLRSPVETRADTFVIREGAALMAPPAGGTLAGALAVFAEAGAEVVPLVWARSVPGGPVDRDFYAAIKARLLAGIAAAGPVDGVLIVNHGALAVTGMDRHGEEDLVLAVRAAAGPQAILGLPFDHHGQITGPMLAELDALSAFRTAPHADQPETGARVARQMLAMLSGGPVPARALLRVPLLLPGERIMSTQGPGIGLFGGLADRQAAHGLVDASLLPGFAWNDAPWTGMQAVALAHDAAAAQTAVLDLARAVWDARLDFALPPGTTTLAAGLDAAAALPGTGHVLSDSGDNVTGGAVGDRLDVLAAALAHPRLRDVALPGLYQPALAVAAARAGIGGRIALPLAGAPEASVEALGDGILNDHELIAPGRWARLRVGKATLSVHERRTAIASPAHLAALDMPLERHAVTVLKLGYLMPELGVIARSHTILLTEGVADLDLARLSWTRVIRPSLPLDPATVFAPGLGDITLAAGRPSPLIRI